jgi:RNA polymerase sigma factor (sigma-70 family)
MVLFITQKWGTLSAVEPIEPPWDLVTAGGDSSARKGHPLAAVTTGMSVRLGQVALRSQSDERLVKLATGGHERAFAVIVERYRPELSVLARRLSPDGKAEDIVQQAFLSAFAALRSGADVRHLRGWLYRIVRNAAARSQAPLCMPLDGATASGESVEDVVQRRVLAKNALAELARLPERQRQAIVGTALDGRGRAEVATSMGVSEGAVRQLVHRARARIRTTVAALAPWPLVRWLTAARPGGGGAVNVAAGVGAASSAGVALKLGIVLASGVIATGVAAVDLHGGARRPQSTDPRAARLVVHSRAGRAHDRVLTVAVLTRARVGGSHAARSAGAVVVAAHRVRARRGRDGAPALPDRHRQGGGAGAGRGSDRGDDAGSRRGGGAGSGLNDGRGAWSGAGPRSGDGGGSGTGDHGGWRVGGADARGDGRSFSGPQAVVASGGGSGCGGDRGGNRCSDTSGSGFGSGPGAGAGSGSEWGPGPGDVGSIPGNGGPSAADGGSPR